MQKLLKIFIGVLLLVGFSLPITTSAKTEKVSGILFNSYTGEKVDDVSINKFKINKDQLSLEFLGTKKFNINADFVEQKEIDGNKLDYYYGKEDSYEVKIVVSGEIISGKFESAELSPAKRVKVNYDDFSFIISRDESINLNDALAKIQMNEEAKKTFNHNKNELNRAVESNSTATSNATAAASYSGSVYANSSAITAQGTVYYNYIGSNMYNINSIKYYASQNTLSTEYGYLSVWSSPNASNALWISPVNNKWTTASVNLTVSGSTNGAAFIAQVHRVGFVKIYGVPIPWFVDDWDFWYF